MCTAGADPTGRRTPEGESAAHAGPQVIDTAVALWSANAPLGWLLDTGEIRLRAGAKDDDLGVATWVAVGELARALAQLVHLTRAAAPAVPTQARVYAREARRLVLLLGEALPWVPGPPPGDREPETIAELVAAGPNTETVARIAAGLADELADGYWTDPAALAGLVLDAAYALGEFGRAVRTVDSIRRGRGALCGAGWRRARRSRGPRSPRR